MCVNTPSNKLSGINLNGTENLHKKIFLQALIKLKENFLIKFQKPLIEHQLVRIQRIGSSFYGNNDSTEKKNKFLLADSFFVNNQEVCDFLRPLLLTSTKHKTAIYLFEKILTKPSAYYELRKSKKSDEKKVSIKILF